MAGNMAGDIVPTNLWRLPLIASELWEDISDLSPLNGTLNGLSISEDSKNVYVEAALPGVDPKNIDVSFEKGVLWIKGDTKEEESGKKYYRKASSSFSYRITVPGEVDFQTEPVATCKNGRMTVAFEKSKKVQPKKIVVKTV